MLFLLNFLSLIVSGTLYFHSLPAESTGINVRAICQDSQGNMWFGGLDGITCYDGSRYTDFRYNANGTDDVGTDHIYELFCDRDGTLWATHLSGLSAYDRVSGSFRNYPSPDAVITSLAPLTEDTFLVTVGSRLWIFDKRKGVFSRENVPLALRDFPVNLLYAPDDTTIYIGSLDGRITTLGSRTQEVKELSAAIGKASVKCLLLNEEGKLWAGTEGTGLWEISPSGNILRHEELGYVRSLCKDGDGTLWIGTKNGLGTLKDGRLNTYHHDYYDSGSITHDSVFEIFRDKQGTMWLGTYYGGVCYCTSRPSVFAATLSHPGENYLNGQVISDIVEGPDGSLWIGTNSGGLNHLRTDGRFEHIGGLSEGFSDQPDIKSIYISPYSGCLFVGADKGAISVLRPGSKRLQSLNVPLRNGSYAIEGGADGILFVGTPDGLMQYNERTGKVSSLPVPGIRSNITALRLGADGILWVGQKFGVSAIRASDGTGLPLPEEMSAIRYVKNFLEDGAGRLWISSSDGLFCYKDGEVSAYTVQDGLPDNVIHGVEEDGDGRLWISTNKGLCRFDPSTGDKWIFTTADGLPGDRFTEYAHCKTRSGEMYFGGLSWLVSFRPERVVTSYKEVLPVISGIEVNGQWRPLTNDTITLKAKERDISLLFSAPDYVSGQDGHFFYKLEGEGTKDHWHEAGMDREASYHGLSYGDYTFLLNYRNSAGIHSPQSVELHFTIPPFWYERPEVKLIFTLLLMSLALFFVLRWLAKKKAEYQSEMERVRNELLNEFSLEFVRIGARQSDASESSVAKIFYKGDEDFMRKAMQVVKKNLDNSEFTVETLASEMNMSRSNLHLRCKALFGVSAHEFIKTVRFNEACRLLLEKKHSVAEIGYMTGFTTPSYFAAAFHRFMGCTPSEYVRKNQRLT